MNEGRFRGFGMPDDAQGRGADLDYRV